MLLPFLNKQHSLLLQKSSMSFIKMAEGMGFEPTEPVKVHSLSRGARSATLAPFLIIFIIKNGGETGIRTLGALRHDGFQDRCFRPLSHLSTQNFNIIKEHFNMAPPTGFEPVTKWLTAIYSTAELRRKILYIFYVCYLFSERDFMLFFIIVKTFFVFFLLL